MERLGEITSTGTRLPLQRSGSSSAEPSASGSLSGYADAGGVSAWASDAMLWAVTGGVISGVTDTTLVPQGGAARAQCAAILMRNA